MVIVGAKGFAKELFEICLEHKIDKDIVFYDDISNDLPFLMFDQIEILRSIDELEIYFKENDNRFVLGFGNPILRRKVTNKFKKMGGVLESLISAKSNIGKLDVHIKSGATILSGSCITTSVQIGEGVLMYPNSLITHDCIIGDFVEFSPGATILGRSVVGSMVSLGANSTILPDINIGSNVIVGAGSVVTKDIPDNSMVMGIPATIVKKLPEIAF